MCQFKSGIILKNRIVLAPEGNESHSDLLESLHIDDNSVNMMKKFVRAELIPPEYNKAAGINLWEFRVDQDFVPDWFENDKKKYEQDFRNAVRDYLIGKFVIICGLPWNIIKKDNGCTYYLLDGENDKKKYEQDFRNAVRDYLIGKFVIICGLPWNIIKKDNGCTYYLLDGILDKVQFGKNNNYNQSYVKEKLNSSDLVEQLKNEFGDRLVPINTNLLSLDGLDDYGHTEGDILSIPTLDLYRECRKNITKIDVPWWLSTPYSTPSGYGSGSVEYVGSNGYVNWDWYGRCLGVRPFFILRNK